MSTSPSSCTDGLTVSVVICAYTTDRWDVLVQAVEAVLRQLRSGDELLLVVDHAKDLLESARAQFTAAQVVENIHPQGLSGARNTAVEIARGDVVAFLDDDVVPTTGWLENMLRLYGDPAVVGVGGQVDAVWSGDEPRWLPPEFLWVVGCSYRGLPTRVSPVRNPIGANMSFRREVFEAVGLFAESLGRVGTLPVGCEETELAIRVGRHYGSRAIVHQPASIVNHHMTRGRERVAYFYRRCWSEGRSKAAVSRLVGDGAALSSERAYVTRTLPRAVARELIAAAGGQREALARAVNVVLGTLVTAAGYAGYRLTLAAHSTSSEASD